MYSIVHLVLHKSVSLKYPMDLVIVYAKQKFMKKIEKINNFIECKDNQNTIEIVTHV